MDEVNREITQLRGRSTEESLDRATKLEQEAEKDLAKNGSEDEIRRRGYDPDDLRKAHRSTQAKRQGKGSGSGSKKKKED